MRYCKFQTATWAARCQELEGLYLLRVYYVFWRRRKPATGNRGAMGGPPGLWEAGPAWTTRFHTSCVFFHYLPGLLFFCVLFFVLRYSTILTPGHISISDFHEQFKFSVRFTLRRYSFARVPDVQRNWNYPVSRKIAQRHRIMLYLG